MRVLVAYAGEAVSEVVQSFLWDQGHETEIAADGLECVATLRHFVPDVLVLDSDLVWGGYAGVLALLRDDPEYHDIPLIVLTASREEFEALDLPSTALWHRKPLRLGVLLRQIAGRERSAGKAKERGVRQRVVRSTEALPGPHVFTVRLTQDAICLEA